MMGNPEIVSTLRRWTIDKALPLWAAQGVDGKRGGFQERLNADGSPDTSAARRLFVQARQIYVFAHATALGWFPGKQLTLDGVDFMISHYRGADGAPGYVSVLAADNSIASGIRDTYDHAFVLFALAWAAKISGDAQLHAHVEDVLTFFDEHLTATDGSFFEGVPARLPRRQNPHMHAFEAMLSLHETIDHPQALKRADRLRTLMLEKFFDRRATAIREFFTDGWMPALGDAGMIIEPGHQAEWAWLLRKHERLCGMAAAPLSRQLLETAIAWSDPASGLLVDEVDIRGSVRQRSRKTWPQTELAKAWIAEVEIGTPGADDKAGLALRQLAQDYHDRPCPGGWLAQVDDKGRPMSDKIPASTLYHLFCAISEADRVLA
jgi:mannose-6-phosphate isomerase